MVVTKEGESMKRWMVAMVGLALLLGFAQATVFLTGASDGCSLMKPGESRMFILSLKQPSDGTYLITVTSDGLYTYPQEITIDVEANETYNKWIKIRAPVNVVDEYYTLSISVFDVNSNLVESKEYCFRVYKGVLASEMPDVVFGQSGVETKDGKVTITLYVTNMGNTPATVTLDADYGLVTFGQNPVIVKPYRTVYVTAEMPVEDTMPEFVTFYAKVGEAEKTVTVRLPVPEAIKPKIELEIPSVITIDQPLTVIPVKIVNEGESPITVKVTGKAMPIGVSVYSDEMEIDPKSSALVKTYVVANNVMKTGQFLSKVCIEDAYGAELKCKYVPVEVLGSGESTVTTTVEANGVSVDLTVKNGAKKYYGVTVEVMVPKGWSYQATPDVFDLGSYETKTVKVTFAPGEDAEDGVAVIRLMAPDGTVIAQKTVNLSTKALTGYATAGESSVIGLIIAAIVIAFIVAAIVKKGKEAEEEEEFAELTKKE